MAADGRRLAAALALSLGLGGAFALVAWWRRRPSRRARWAASDLAALHLPPGFLFVYKQFDLHLDHPTEPVTLQAQLCTRYAGLRDATTRHGFRLIHQLDYATSGVLAVGLDKKAAASGAKVFAERRACKYYLALVHGVRRTPGLGSKLPDIERHFEPACSQPRAVPTFRVFGVPV